VHNILESFLGGQMGTWTEQSSVFLLAEVSGELSGNCWVRICHLVAQNDGL